MDIIGFIALVIFVFCLGWLTGNIVEWIQTNKERRLEEKWIADYNNSLFKDNRE